MKISLHSGVLESVDMSGVDFATLPGGGLIALDCDNDATRFQVFTSLALRVRWISLVVSWLSRR